MGDVKKEISEKLKEKGRKSLVIQTKYQMLTPYVKITHRFKHSCTIILLIKMSQSAVVAVSAAFITNGILTWISPEFSAAANWIISGLVALVAGYATIALGKS